MRKYSVEVKKEEYILNADKKLSEKVNIEEIYSEKNNKLFENKEKAIEYAKSIKLNSEFKKDNKKIYLSADYVEVYKFDKNKEDTKVLIYSKRLTINDVINDNIKNVK